jgi:hypothetical protein
MATGSSVVKEARPLLSREIEVQAAKRPNPADGDRDHTRHPRHDPAVKQDAAPTELADVDQVGGLLVPAPAPTEPQVTDVTAASTSGVREGEHEGHLAWVLGEPSACLRVDLHDEHLHHATA